ncbi:M23 family metallopeptidase [Adlercreutzia sp. ZJ242]|uniref:M23 family metallopeptidase n=1 Tax=Adlercreutzia sp. ZJ242 TaxID=2709409 RepID=UPI0013E9B634|nr:M23 family metallopeptidase [Adlercreutzia sp. ZJ242]
MTKTTTRMGRAALACALASVLAVPALGAGAAAPQQAWAVTSSEKQVEADEIAAAIDALQTNLNEANAEYERAMAEHEAASAAADEAQARAEEARERIADLQERLGDRARGMYKTGGSASLVEVLLGTSTFEEFLVSWDAIQMIAGQDADLIQESKDARAEAEAAEADYREQQEKAAAEMTNAKAAQEEIAVTKASMETQLAKVTEEIAVLQAKEEQERIAAEEAARRAELEKQYVQQMQQSAGSGASSGGGASAAVPNTGGWTSPCPGYYGVTCEFGYSPITGSHNGIDLGASSGTPILSAKSGTVTYVGWYGTGGNSVIVSHGDGVRTIYMHQSQTAASVGQQVSAGDLIGYVGSTGLSTGPHLHFQIEVNGTPINPRNFFSF